MRYARTFDRGAIVSIKAGFASSVTTMTRCLMVFHRAGRYFRIPDAEVEDWDEVREELDAEPSLIERVDGFAPYTHAYRLPNGTIYLVAPNDDDHPKE